MTPDTVLAFWFGPLDADGFCIEDRDRLWFRGGRETDRRIREQFAVYVEQALTGALDNRAATPRGRLALIILLDQFTRNIHRGSAAAFSGDEHALRLARDGVEQGQDRQLAPIERTFFYLPFEHAEELDTQNRSVALFRALQTELPQRLRPKVRSALEHAIQHRDIIARFGRFPHRNRVLGRPSTPAENDYLADASTFGQ